MRKLLCACLSLWFVVASIRANSYLYLPLSVPKSADIVAFSNGLPPGTGSRRMLSRARVIRFLERGRNNTYPATWPQDESEYGSPCDGVIVDRAGQVYFWTLIAKRGLRLETAEGRTAFLELR